MSTLSYALAKELLSEVEKDRIVCTYLSSTDPTVNVDWEKAASEFGSASAESYKKGIQKTMKKLKATMGEGEPAGATKGGKKRKAAAAKATDAQDDGEAPKKKGRKPKKTAVKVEEGEDDAE